MYTCIYIHMNAKSNQKAQAPRAWYPDKPEHLGDIRMVST